MSRAGQPITMRFGINGVRKTAAPLQAIMALVLLSTRRQEIVPTKWNEPQGAAGRVVVGNRADPAEEATGVGELAP